MSEPLRPAGGGGAAARSRAVCPGRRTALSRVTVLLAALAACALPAVADARKRPERHPGGRFPAVESEIDSLVEQVRTDSGFTIDPRDGRAPTSGYVVGTGVGAHVEKASVFFGRDAAGGRTLMRYLGENAARLASHRDLHVGAWYDRANQRVVLSIVQLVADRDVALELGVKHHQRAVYDLSNRRDVLTGSPGRRPPEDPR
ncbi:hypothetical protein [Streptomyces sp. BRA346]|uniref:hypothetical protein n=1 Tax=Streptomyces sp. BRA346 TaxID=2878199 RepID=UPI004064BDA9